VRTKLRLRPLFSPVRRRKVDKKPAAFLRHYPAHKNGQLNISELARVCDISRTTAYKYKSLLEVKMP
jgi:predicted AAA+ superfamily ATPase